MNLPESNWTQFVIKILLLVALPHFALADSVENALINKYRALDQYYLERSKIGHVSDEKDNKLRLKILRPADSRYQKALKTWEEKLLKKYGIRKISPQQMRKNRLKAEKELRRNKNKLVKKSKILEKNGIKNIARIEETSFTKKSSYLKSMKEKNKATQSPMKKEIIINGEGIPEYIEFRSKGASRKTASDEKVKKFEILYSTDQEAFGEGENQEVIEFQKN